MVQPGGWSTRKNADGDTEWIPPPHLDRGQPELTPSTTPRNFSTKAKTTSGSTFATALINVSPMNRQRTLLLMRHAKSDYPDGVADHDRPLASRGIREAGLAGDWLRANAPTIDQVLCSTATRARQTLERTGVSAPVRYAERLYDAAPGTMIQEINMTSENVNTLLVVGHEPTMSAVAIGLAGADGTDVDAVERISKKFSTSAVAVLAVPCDWKSLDQSRAALIDFRVPR
jgi:phosphohistidine phosphatase